MEQPTDENRNEAEASGSGILHSGEDTEDATVSMNMGNDAQTSESGNQNEFGDGEEGYAEDNLQTPQSGD